MNQTSSRPTLLIVGILVTVLLCCLCLTVLAGASVLVGLRNFQTQATGPQSFAERIPPTVVFVTPDTGTLPPIQSTPTPLPVTPLNQNTFPRIFDETLITLDEAVVPVNDLIELAERLEGKQNIPTTLDPPLISPRAGDRKNFWVSNVDTNRNYQIDATLEYVTDHLYFWIEDGVPFDDNDLRRLAETFEDSIYPTNREFFGSEWTPGVDGDPRLYVIYARGLGNSIAGYYSSADQYHPMAHEYSNAHEMFLLSADNLYLDDSFTYGVLAHEFQHMIHWYQDRNEETWLNEGFSELASFLNGYGTGGSDYVYAQDTDQQLTTWPNNGYTIPHYGASFLFVNYFLNRFGAEATQAVVRSDANGMASVDQVLEEMGIRDPLTGLPITAEDVFGDWAVANLLRNTTLLDGRYGYANYPDSPEVQITDEIGRCPTGAEDFTVAQHGVDYYRITCSGNYLLRFSGEAEVGVLPTDSYSGRYAYWSNRGDESHMTLTREFDFSNVSGPLTLSYQTWYDLEEDYDYLYLTASTDGGETWQILFTPGGTASDPSGNSYGWAYNGSSGFGPSWVQEDVDLTEFAGEKVLLRFEYVTDAAVNGEGFLLDDVAVPETGYFSDFEADDGGWIGEGFVRIQNVLPQSYRVSLVTFGDEINVQPIPLNSSNVVEFPLILEDDVTEAVLVVSGTTRYTRQPAEYQLEILPQP
jgi:immune inhibitor A